MDYQDTDLLDPQAHGFDNEPFYEWLREEAPLYRDNTNSIWAVSRYDDVIHVSKNTDIFCSGQGVVPTVPLEGGWTDHAMINKDGAEHTCQRGLVSKGFTPRRIAELEGDVTRIVARILDQLEPKGEFDLVRDLARPFPMRVIGQMLGYKEENCDDVLDWTDIYTKAGGGMRCINNEVMEAFYKFVKFHGEVLDERKKKRGDDLISIWLDAELNGERLSEDKLMFEHNLLLVGGSETTRHTISVGMYELLKRPEDMRFLADNTDAIPNAVEEMVRWTTPFVRMQRTLLKDHEMHGQLMKEGDKIVMLYPAANRDPRAFDDPQKFDVRRKFKNPALAFGHGRHYCLGAWLARLEMRILLEQVLERFPDLALAPGAEPEPKPSAFLRGLAGLRVVVSPAQQRRDSAAPSARPSQPAGRP